MKMTLPRFYTMFMLVSLGLFSFEDKNLAPKTHNKNRVEEVSKEEKTNKKQYRHRYRYSNLC